MIQQSVTINIPLTAVNGIILLMIYDDEEDFRPVNKAVLVERFIELLLEKTALGEAQRGRFDYRNKEHYLAYIAGLMVDADSYDVDFKTIYDWTRKYLEDYGFSNEAQKFIEELVRAKIFVDHANLISFRYRAFLEFFAARRMKDDPAFRKKLTDSPETAIQFVNEIEFYSGLGRDDGELLEAIGLHFRSFTDELYREMGGIPDLNVFDGLPAPHENDQSSLIEKVTKQLNLPPLTDEEKDTVLQEELPVGVGRKQSVRRPNYKFLTTKWLACLVLYSKLVKNTELIGEADKRRHLEAVFEGWALFLLSVIIIAPLIAHQRELWLDGVRYRVNLPEDWSEEKIVRFIMLASPRGIANTIKFQVGSEKLREQLNAPLSPGEAKITTLFRTALYGDLKLHDYMSNYRKLEQNLRDAGFLYESLLWKLIETRFFVGGGRPETEKSLRHLVSTMLGSVRGVDKAEREKLAAERYQRLNRQDLLRRLKDKSSGKSPNVE